MKTVKSTVGFLFSSSRRGSGTASDEEEKSKPKVSYHRRFSVPYNQHNQQNHHKQSAASHAPVREECEYPIYQWPSFRLKNANRNRRHSVAVGQEDSAAADRLTGQPSCHLATCYESPAQLSTSTGQLSKLPVCCEKQLGSCRLAKAKDEEDERRPSLASLQAEDRERRPSIIMYQSEDSQHPDVIALQRLVESINFSEQEKQEETSDEKESSPFCKA